jgi:ketosteroid isomerase-like protein
VFAALTAIPAFGQEWSAAQKAVWDNVKTYWDLGDKGDVEGYLSYLHDDYRGWGNGSPLPLRKADVRKGVSHFFKLEKPELTWIEPVNIQILDDVAIVHYFFALHFKDEEGKVQNRSGRWMDVLVKQGDRWLLIADQGGNNPSSN